MFDSLRSLRPEVAAGILADTALRLEGQQDANSTQFVESQDQIESALLKELRDLLHLGDADFSAQAIEQITDVLDAQATNILAALTPSNEMRLSAAGILAADVYDLNFSLNLVNDFSWRWPLESALASETVRSPHRQQVLGGSGLDNFPALTIYGRFFQHRFPARSFWMLVIGERAGFRLNIAQVWRAYPSEINLENCETLLDVIKLIAERFGVSIELNGKHGKFFWATPVSETLTASNEIRLPAQGTDLATVTFFQHSTSNGIVAALVVPMNLTKYFKYVDNWRGWDEKLRDSLDIINKRQAA